MGLDKETEAKALKALEMQQRRNKRQNEYIKNTFDRQGITLPRGTKDAIKERGYTVNGLINQLVKEWLENN